MKSKLRFLTARLVALGVLLCLCTVFAVLGFRASHKQQITYNGKTFSYWFNQLPLAGNGTLSGFHTHAIRTRLVVNGRNYGDFNEPFTESQKAIRALSTNELKLLFATLTKRDNRLKNWVELGASKCGLKK